MESMPWKQNLNCVAICARAEYEFKLRKLTLLDVQIMLNRTLRQTWAVALDQLQHRPAQRALVLC